MLRETVDEVLDKHGLKHASPEWRLAFELACADMRYTVADFHHRIRAVIRHMQGYLAEEKQQERENAAVSKQVHTDTKKSARDAQRGNATL
jgi:hypothetical protein